MFATLGIIVLSLLVVMLGTAVWSFITFLRLLSAGYDIVGDNPRDPGSSDRTNVDTEK